MALDDKARELFSDVMAYAEYISKANQELFSQIKKVDPYKTSGPCI